MHCIHDGSGAVALNFEIGGVGSGWVGIVDDAVVCTQRVSSHQKSVSYRLTKELICSS